MEEEAENEDVYYDDETCSLVVDDVIRHISRADGDGYNQYRTIDLLFERIIDIYKHFDFEPEDIVQTVYERYEIEIH